MDKSVSNEKKERLEIIRQYKKLIEAWSTRKDTEDRWLVRKAFRMAVEAHKKVRRKSGEPFVMHPIAVAMIAAKEIGLGRTSIIAALLHDTVEDTSTTLDDIRESFGEDVAKIIDGLTKIEKIPSEKSSAQAETLKKIIFSLTIDVRIILIKFADRLHNMRTLGSMPSHKQMRVVSETQFLLAPLANRLGLNAIKSELEDLSLKHSLSDIYHDVFNKIKQTEESRNLLFNDVRDSLTIELNKINIKFKIKLKVDSTNTVWVKMNSENRSFEDINSIFSVDIILDVDPLVANQACWSAFSVITEKYKSKRKRLRDWLSTTKTNGYEAIHATIMYSTGQWIDIHIRSTRMDEIANRGYAAYWKYKDDINIGASFDLLLKRIKLHLKDNVGNDDESSTFNFLNDLKEDLLSEDVVVYTPKGKEVRLRAGSTVLDFAYTIHSDLGNHCIAGKIDNEIYSLDYILKSDDQIEIWTNETQKPNAEWYKYVRTASAKSKITKFIKNQRKEFRSSGEEKLAVYFKQLNIENTRGNISKLLAGSKINGLIDLYYFIAHDLFGLKDIKEIMLPNESRIGWLKSFKYTFTKPKITPIIDDNKVENIKSTNPNKTESITDFNNLDYTVPNCCNPVPGDNVVGIELPHEPIQIHSTSCPQAILLMSRHGKNIIKAKWKHQKGFTFLAGISIMAADSIGLIKEIIEPITDVLKINVKSFNLKSRDGLATIDITVYVASLKELNKLIATMRKIKSTKKVIRLEKI